MTYVQQSLFTWQALPTPCYLIWAVSVLVQSTSCANGN